MYKVVIWGTGQTYHHYINMGKLQEIIKKIRGVLRTTNIYMII